MAFFLIAVSTSCFANDEFSQEPILWGGGGAFTSVEQFQGHLYLSSDVSGVWQGVNNKWQPYVTGLNSYNVTALVTFNQRLFAITEDALQYTEGDGKWVTLDVEINTYRSITDQVYSISEDQKHLCIANRDQRIVCLNEDFKNKVYETATKTVNGLFFLPNESRKLYYYSKKQLFTLDLKTKKSLLIKKFGNNVTSLLKFDESVIIATTKKIFKMDNLVDELYATPKNKKIVNLFRSDFQDKTKLYLATGSKWHTKVHELNYNSGPFITLAKGEQLKLSFDKALPHRKNQRSLTKFLSINNINGTAFLTDYWGVYKLSHINKSVLQEVTADAYNVVATDLIVADNHFYVSTMDNGVIKIDKYKDRQAKRDIKAISFDQVKGHAWSMIYYNKTLHAIFSPWDKANDYLFKYSELTGNKVLTKLTDYKNRDGRGAFWGRGYSRAITYYYGLISFRDGANGGLISHNRGIIKPDEQFRFGEYNRVYAALSELNGMLYVASCESPSTIVAINNELDSEFTIKLPRGFCAFKSYQYGNSIFFLGAQNGFSVIYKLTGRKIEKLMETQKGSAFYAMAINPSNNDEVIIATISWSKKPTSSLFTSTDSGKTWKEKSGLISHHNGIVAISFWDKDNIAILQKVGGLIHISGSELF